jgi:hypothetical protein
MSKDMSKDKWSDVETFELVCSKSCTPSVSINTKKSIVLSSAFLHYAKTQMLGMTHAILHFSRSNNAIIFTFTKDDSTPGATKISRLIKLKPTCNARISASAFFKHYSLDVSKYAGRYVAKLEDIPSLGESWVVYLDE